jgi:hypothetical protein
VTVAGLAAGSVGFALAAAVAALATAGYHQELQTHSDLVGLGSGVAAVTGYLLLLPLGATALRIMAVRPAGLAALGAWALVGSIVFVTGQTNGVLPFWVYGLVAFGAYALVAVAAVLAAEEPPPVGMDGEVIGRGRRRLLVLIAGTLAIVVVNVFGQTMSIDYPGLPSDTSVATLHIGASINAVAFSPDGHSIALGGESDTIALWKVSATTQPVPAAIDVVGGVTGSVHALAFSPDGGTLITANRGNPPELWRVSDSPGAVSAEVVSTDVIKAGSPMECLAFSPQGRLAMGGGPDFTPALWTVGSATPSVITLLHGHTSIVMAVAFSPDGRTLATGSDDGTAKLWAVGS